MKSPAEPMPLAFDELLLRKMYPVGQINVLQTFASLAARLVNFTVCTVREILTRPRESLDISL